MHVTKKVLAMAGIAAVALTAAPAFAHHSGAMFEREKVITLNGTIKEFQWTNPHSWIQIVAKDASGKDVEWSIEGGSPNALVRAGWKPASLKPGDKAVMIVHPLKDGGPGGNIVSVEVNGQKIGTGS